ITWHLRTFFCGVAPARNKDSSWRRCPSSMSRAAARTNMSTLDDESNSLEIIKRDGTLVWPLLTSGHSSPHLAMKVALMQTTRSPRVLRTHLHAYLCRIYAATLLCKYWALHLLACSPAASPLSGGCSSEQRFAYSFLRIPPHGGHPCRSVNTPLAGCVEGLHV